MEVKKKGHLPLVDLLIGVYDLLAVDDASRAHTEKLSGFAREAIQASALSDGSAQCALEEVQRRCRAYSDQPRIFDCGNAIAAIRKAMRRMELYNGVPCQAAEQHRQAIADKGKQFINATLASFGS